MQVIAVSGNKGIIFRLVMPVLEISLRRLNPKHVNKRDHFRPEFSTRCISEQILNRFEYSFGQIPIFNIKYTSNNCIQFVYNYSSIQYKDNKKKYPIFLRTTLSRNFKVLQSETHNSTLKFIPTHQLVLTILKCYGVILLQFIAEWIIPVKKN